LTARISGGFARGAVAVLLAGGVLSVAAATPASAATRDLYVANLRSNSVSVIDPGSNTVVATIPVGRMPQPIAFSPDAARAYVGHFISPGVGGVDVIDTATDTVTADVTVGNDPFALGQAPAAPPTVSGISPDHGPEAGGTTVTVTGDNLGSTTAVTFGAVPGSNVTVVDDHTVTVTAPPHAVGPVDVTVTNPAGTSPTSSADRYSYIYSFGGFLAPVANPPAVNKAHAGQSIPVSFSLGGNQGLGIMAAGYPMVQQVNCSNGSPIGSSAPAGTAGNSGLQYNRATATYTFVWKTAKAFAGTCQVFTLGLNDGTFHTANFKFS
jgi:YVTN family beta-propeller protein